jgi:phosphate transport system substrate-binding protein
MQRPRMHFLAAAVMVPLALFGRGTAAQQVTPNTPPARVPGYVLPTGELQIVTCAGMADAVKALNALFVKSHPGARFKLRTGDNYSVMATLTFDRTLVGPLCSEYTRIGLGSNLKIAADPVAIRIAHASMAPGARPPMLGLIVNPANPLTALSRSEVERLYAAGAPGGSIATWGQAGATGILANRRVHPVGPLRSDYRDSEDPQAGELLEDEAMGGLGMNHTYVGLSRYADVIERVREDPAAIGIVALNVPLDGVKMLALRASDTAPTVQPDAASIESGRYPLDRFVYLSLRVAKGASPDPLAIDYVRLALSEAGQRAIAAAGFIPLNPMQRAAEQQKLLH